MDNDITKLKEAKAEFEEHLTKLNSFVLERYREL